MKVVELYPTQTEANVLYLIVEAPTGIIYTNQCGGTSCYEMKAQGFLVPIGREEDCRRLFDWFWSRYKGSCWGGGGYLAKNPAHVDELRKLVADLGCFKSADNLGEFVPLELDMSRIAECCEAWIPVLSHYGKGYLTFINSD